MEKKLESEIEPEKGLESVSSESLEMPVLIKFNEFIYTVSKSREFKPETIGGFVYWMKREGIPKSLPFDRWKDKLEKYSKRIV